MPTTIPAGESPADLPAGTKRNEAKARVKDELEQKGEERAAQLETEAIDPSKFHVENEIAQHFDPSSLMLRVTNPDPAYHYCWVSTREGGLHITSKQIEGWEVVQGDMEEAIDKKGIGADTTRRVGDVLLMRIRLDRFYVVEKRRIAAAHRFDNQGSTFSSESQALAEKYNIPIYDSLDDTTLRRMQAKSNAQRIGKNAVNQMLRTGRMPGARI